MIDSIRYDDLSRFLFYAPEWKVWAFYSEHVR